MGNDVQLYCILLSFARVILPFALIIVIRLSSFCPLCYDLKFGMLLFIRYKYRSSCCIWPNIASVNALCSKWLSGPFSLVVLGYLAVQRLCRELIKILFDLCRVRSSFAQVLHIVMFMVLSISLMYQYKYSIAILINTVNWNFLLVVIFFPRYSGIYYSPLYIRLNQ